MRVKMRVGELKRAFYCNAALHCMTYHDAHGLTALACEQRRQEADAEHARRQALMRRAEAGRAVHKRRRVTWPRVPATRRAPNG